MAADNELAGSRRLLPTPAMGRKWWRVGESNPCPQSPFAAGRWGSRSWPIQHRLQQVLRRPIRFGIVSWLLGFAAGLSPLAVVA